MTPASSLRLSALRAFLGRIHPEMRLIKIKSENAKIVLSIILDREPTDRIREDISEASTEIIADYRAPHKIEGHFEISSSPLANEDVSFEGWIYRRAEP